MSFDRRKLAGPGLMAVFGAAAVLWVFVAIASWSRSPNLEGVLTGLFGGFMLALFTVGGGAWLVMSLVLPGRTRDADRPAPALTGDLRQTLAELETVRQTTAVKIRRRSLWLVPLGAAAGAAIWTATQFTDDPADAEGLFAFIGVGAFGGYAWAQYRLAEAYRRLYKARVLPLLARQFGDLAWRPARLDIGALRRHGLFEPFDSHKAEDEIVGTRRGLPLSLVELRLTRGAGKKRVLVFHGLLVSVRLPRGLGGTTVVASDRGPFGNLRRRLAGGPCERVRLEDPEFEQHYEVYGSDQVGARALLTPAFMQRFMELARSQRFGAPVALAEGPDFLMALPGLGRGDLFEPPSHHRPAAAEEALRTLAADLQHVMDAADAVIDLDQAGRRTRAGEPSPAGSVDPPWDAASRSA